jgi:hypothetical protein
MMGSIPLDLVIVYIYRRATAIIAIVSHYLIQKGQLVSFCSEKSFLGTHILSIAHLLNSFHSASWNSQPKLR